MEPHHYTDFKSDLIKISKEMIRPDQLFETIYVDSQIPLNEISSNLFQEISQCGPFGEGNPEPVFYTNQLQCIECKLGKYQNITYLIMYCRIRGVCILRITKNKEYDNNGRKTNRSNECKCTIY